MQSAKYTVCGRTVRAKFKVQSVHSVWTVGPRSVSGCRASSAPSEPAAHCGKATLGLISPGDAFWVLGEIKSYPKLFQCCSLMSVIWLYPPAARLFTLISNWFIRSPRKNSQLMFCDCRTTAVPPHLYIVGLHERTNQPLPQVTPSLHVWLAASQHNTDPPYNSLPRCVTSFIFPHLHTAALKPHTKKNRNQY